MSIFDDLITEAKNKNLSAAQVPVTQVTTVPTVKKDDLVQLVKQQAEALKQQSDMIAALNAKLTASATQVPISVPTIAAPAKMTRISSYPGKAGEYKAGFKWHAKPHVEGTYVRGGVSIDTLYQIRVQFPKGKEKEFFNEIDAVLSNDEIMKTTYAYQKILAEKGKIVI